MTSTERSSEAVTQPELPSRKELREALLPFAAKSTGRGLRLVAFDGAAFVIAILCVAGPTGLLIKIAASLVVWIQIARLFIIGHDACHQSLTANRRLNRALGKIAFLPSLTPYKLWEIGHNMAHHGFTNLKGRDYVWAPFSPSEYLDLPAHRKLLERIYRSGFGHWLYYLIELWWRKLFFPSREEVGGDRRMFIREGMVVTAFAFVWMTTLVLGAVLFAHSIALNLLLGFFVPFLLWNELMGFVIYVHHTDSDVVWHSDSSAWAKAQPHITSTVQIQFPGLIGALLHNIMDHPAHHLDMTIPLYNLKAAQARLDELVPGYIVKRRLSWRWYWDCVKLCKTYDFAGQSWRPFPS